MTEQTKAVTPKFRAAFARVFRPNEESEKYEITMVFDKESDLAPIKKAVKEYCEANGIPTKGLEMPWKSGDEKADKDDKYEWMRGKFLVGAKTMYKPAIVDQKRIPIDDEEEFYSGCYAKAVISPYAWEFKKKKGIGFNPLALQKIADGERLGGGGINVEDYFSEEKVEEVESGDDFNL